MSFSQEVADLALLLSNRSCCICHRFVGKKIELHHIIPKSKDGKDTFENCIPLCFDCHEEVGSYNEKHPKGRKFSTNELKKHRDSWYVNSKIKNDEKEEKIKEVTDNVVQIVSGKGHSVAGRDLNISSKKIVKKNVVIPDAGGRHITDQEAFKIKEEIGKYSHFMNEAGLNANPSKVWTKLYRHFQVPTYREIPSGCAEEAIKIIQIEKAKARPKVRRKNTGAWKNQFYTAIYAGSNNLGMSKKELYEFANEHLTLRKPISSLKDLTQKQLQDLDRKIKAKKKNG